MNFLETYKIAKLFEALWRGMSYLYFVFLFFTGILAWAIWMLVRRKVSTVQRKRVLQSLLVALAVAPSIFGFDLGALTLPAAAVIGLSLLGPRVAAIGWSLVSIGITFALTLLVWNCFAKWLAAKSTRRR